MWLWNRDSTMNKAMVLERFTNVSKSQGANGELRLDPYSDSGSMSLSWKYIGQIICNILEQAK